MGYTHYFHMKKELNKSKFLDFVLDANKIIEHSQNVLGIDLGDWDGENEPTVTPDEVVFNGSTKQAVGKWTTTENITIPCPSENAGLTENDDPIQNKKSGVWFGGDEIDQRTAPINHETGYGSGDYETLTIKRINNGGGSCKTAFRPYDLTVTAVLIALKHYFPDSLILSDGQPKDWRDGQILCFNLFGYGMDFKLNSHKEVENFQYDDKTPEEKKEEAKAQKAAEIEKLKIDYSFLKQLSTGDKSRIIAAKNIRTELKREFPGVKFSVRTEIFSGGDSIDVSWTDGPNEEEVNATIDKYQEGSFNGMEDIYEYSSTPFNNLFGGAKYVNGSRKVTNERYTETAAALGYTITIDKHFNFSGCDYQQAETIRRETRKKSFYKKPETKGNKIVDKLINNALGFVTIRKNEEKNGIEIIFKARPEARVLDNLKKHGFRWSRYNKLWYNRNTAQNWEFAQTLIK